MSKHELGADRVLHEGAGYRDKYKFKSQKPPEIGRASCRERV